MKKDFKKTIYGFPILPKAGLANMLIPWADCLVGSVPISVSGVAGLHRSFTS